MLNKFFMRWVSSGLCLSLGMAALPSYAGVSLQTVMHKALTMDPTVREAEANVSGADAQIKVSEAGHLPVVSVSGGQSLLYRDNHDSADQNKPAVGLRSTLNLYSWGAVEHSIERDKYRREYFQYKSDEIREQLGLTIGELYLQALRAKENMAIYKESMIRYQKILKDLNIIASYDTGRKSETVEAQARYLQAQASLAGQERIAATALSKLSRYTDKLLQSEDLEEPFKNITIDILKENYTSKSQLSDNPSYLAQQAEFNRTLSQAKVSKAQRFPAVNLVGEVNRRGYNVNVNVVWNLFDPASKYTAVQDGYTAAAAESKMFEIQRTVQENSQTAEISMRQSLQYMKVASQQIQSQKQVVKVYEDQFMISRRTLLDVLDSYQNLTAIQISEASARNDYRDAVLAYLAAQAQVSEWAGVAPLKGL